MRGREGGTDRWEALGERGERGVEAGSGFGSAEGRRRPVEDRPGDQIEWDGMGWEDREMGADVGEREDGVGEIARGTRVD